MRLSGKAVMVPVHFNRHHFFLPFMLNIGCCLLFCKTPTLLKVIIVVFELI